MKRPIVLLSVLLAGCHTQRPTDPFLPKTTVPPPKTSSYSTTGPAPQYYPGPSNGVPATNSAPLNNAAPLPQYTPQGGYPASPGPGKGAQALPGPQRSTAGAWVASGGPSRRSAAGQSSPDTQSQVEQAGYTQDLAGPSTGVTQTQYAPRVRIRTPQTASDAAPPPDTLRRLVSDDRAIDILDLPPARPE
ncbi:MAG TPA: hypothetical protein VGX78_05425 [Pirellulales bacterium]|jgi:hypothetical protein|nr:hypothetical protein [Pirellulales bacterium]